MVSFFKKFLFLIGLVCIDQLAKYLFFDMKLLDSIFFSVFNHGISFGIGLNSWIILIVSILFIILVSVYRYHQKLHTTIIILLLAGAIGNLIDRAILGGVRDFIRLGWGPVFNCADMMISGAVAWYIREEIGKKSV